MDNDLDVLLNTVKLAGAKLLALQSSEFNITQKGDNDIVTQGDLLVNEILYAELMHYFPDDGWLSEETADDLTRLNRSRVWVVDPIDGTREFAAGIPEYAISVALVEYGVPQVSVVFNPAKNELFYAARGRGAWFNQQRIFCERVMDNKYVLLASRSESRRGEWASFALDHEIQIVGSIAYKLALVAAGRAHATFSLGPKHEWDIAAGVLLVTEAGGVALTKDRLPIVFNQADVKVNGIVATSAHLRDSIFELIRPRTQ